jgi:hypothetical protein
MDDVMCANVHVVPSHTCTCPCPFPHPCTAPPVRRQHDVRNHAHGTIAILVTALVLTIALTLTSPSLLPDCLGVKSVTMQHMSCC